MANIADSNKSSGALAVATKICVSLVETATEERKIAATESGILPELKLILDDPPPRPALAPPFVLDVKPESIALPLSRSSSRDSFESDDQTSKKSTSNGLTVKSGESLFGPNGGRKDPQASALAAEASPSMDAEKNEPGPVEDGALTEASETLADQATEVGSEATAKPALVLTTIVDAPEEVAATADVTSPIPTSILVNSTIKLSRSSKSKGVSFDDPVVIVETKNDNGSEDGGQSTVDSPQPLHEPSLHEPRAKESAEAVARQETKNKEDMYQQAYWALDHIIQEVSKDGLDTISEAYVAAGLHQSFIKALDK